MKTAEDLQRALRSLYVSIKPESDLPPSLGEKRSIDRHCYRGTSRALAVNTSSGRETINFDDEINYSSITDNINTRSFLMGRGDEILTSF
jgi:hypothetical protein